jgi:DMSO/TMAO reductase YedYZ molybdopterin-dependent catalytic subunit/thiosulfate reductase cytochrome b subunit
MVLSRQTPVAYPDAASGLPVAGVQAPDPPRHTLVVRVTHWISAAAFAVLVVSGIAILLAHPRLYWGDTGAVGGPSLIDLPLPFVLDVPIRGPGRYLHFLAAWVCVFAGLVYVLRGLLTGHFARNFRPPRGELRLRAIRDVVAGHLRAPRGGDDVPAAYNVLQRISYTAVVFVLLPLMICTGLAMSPAVTSVVPAVVTGFGGQQSARTIHFFGGCALALFVLLHVALVWRSGFMAHTRAMITGRTGRRTKGAGMSGTLSRRRLITTGLGAVAGVGVWRATASVMDRYGLIPANCRGVYGLSETLTYAGQRLLTKLPSTAREFDRSQISTVIPVNGAAPTTEPYQRLLASGFADWRLTIDGLVERPGSLSLADLKRFASRSQITHQACEEGWSFVAEWTGVPLADVLEHMGMRPEARFVFFFTFDGWWDSIDMDDALHPQTLLAYAMNGSQMPTDHGAPLRLKVPRQLGYKNLKYLSRMTVTDTAKGIGDGLGSGSPSAGYSWYAGI